MLRDWSKPPRLFAIVGATALVVAGVAYAARGDHPRSGDEATTTSASATTVAQGAPGAAGPSDETASEAPVVNAAPSAAASAAPVDVVAELHAAMQADDEPKKIAALEKVAEAKDVRALPKLLTTDLSREPEAAPTLIHTVAKLAKEAAPNDRADAAKTLGKWLGEESKRHDPDAEGNVPNLVEALGAIGNRESVDALVAALESGKLDLSVQTLAAQQLTGTGDPRALEAVKGFLARVSQLPAGQGIDEELRVEALAAANRAVSTLQGGSK